MTQYIAILAELIGVVAATMILGLSPAFKRRPLIFKYPRREGVIALALGLLLTGAAWAVITNFPSGALVVLVKLVDFTAADLNQMVLYAALVAILPVALLLVRRQPWLSAGLSRQTLKGSLQLGLALALLSIFLRGKIYSLIDGVSVEEINYLLAAVLVGFALEFAFRGYIQPRLSAWQGETTGWLGTAVLATLFLLPQKLFLSGLTGTTLLIEIALLVAFNLIQGWIFKRAGHILAPGLFHAIHLWAGIL
jgi:membrane protease YdiL (CAAX protease family)